MFANSLTTFLRPPLNGTKSCFYQRTEESFASGCAFQTTLYWKSAKPLSSLPESPTGLLTAIIIKAHRQSWCSGMIMLPTTQKFPPTLTTSIGEIRF